MDWFNPVEWLAWVYGKLFLGHARIGGAIVVLLFAVFGFILWTRAVDKYEEEHSPKQEAAKVNSPATEPFAAPAVPAPNPDTQPPSTHTHKPEIKKPTAPSSTPSVVTPPSISQNCPGGICAGGDISGNPTIINPAPPPPKLQVTQEPLPPRDSDYPEGSPDPSLLKHPGVRLNLSVDRSLFNPRFVARCDRPCRGMHQGLPAGGGLSSGSRESTTDATIVALFIDFPNPLAPGVVVEWDVRSRDDKPIHIMEIGIIPVK